MSLLEETLAEIEPVDRGIEDEVRARLDDLTKPPGSLGRLEEIALRYCLARGSAAPEIGAKVIFTFAGDHGVAEEGVSAYPSDVTRQMVLNMLEGGAAVNVLARQVGAQVRVVDIGVASDLGDAPGLVVKRLRSGTRNMTQGPAMTRDEAIEALEVGIALARDAADLGVGLIGTGDMGIGNTTASAALIAALLPCPPEEVTGRGTGIDDRTLEHKVEVVRTALEVNVHELTTPLGALASVGGFEIAGIAGVILGAASRSVPVVVDGFISSAAALVACKLCEHVDDRVFYSHLSAEAGHRTFFERSGSDPLLDLGMRLGEGTGAALAMGLVEASVAILTRMATFSSAGVSGKLS